MPSRVDDGGQGDREVRRGLQDRAAYFDVLKRMAEWIAQHLIEGRLPAKAITAPTGEVVYLAAPADELRDAGLRDIDLDANGYVTATLPRNVAEPGPVVGLLAELLTEGQRRGEVPRELHAAVAALEIVAGAALPGAQAAALRADPAVAVEASLDINWRGVAS